MLKNPCTQVMTMYKFQSKDTSFIDFNQPLGLEMDPNNRWVQKAALIPWDDIEQKYAKQFLGFKGKVAKPARLAIGALLIQMEYGYSDAETVEQIQENPYLQYFCGLTGYAYRKPFNACAMTRFRKRFSAEQLAEINEAVIQEAIKRAEERKTADSHKDDSHKPDPPSGSGNLGTLIVDATCAPSQIKYPRDIELLNEGREKLEKIIDHLHDPKTDGKKPRTYRHRARKQYLNIARCKKNSARKLQKGIRQQLQYIRRDEGIIQTYLSKGKHLEPKVIEQLQIIHEMCEQQKYMYEHHTHTVPNRIVNLRQPYLRPIVRGKAKNPVEFGAKLDISVVDGMVRLEQQSFEAYNESELLITEIKRYHARYGQYPERVLADKIYRNRKNLAYCKTLGIRLSGPALGRPKKDAVIDKKTEYKDSCDRVEVERAFSLAKRKFGLMQIRTYLKETTQAVIALAILALNLSQIQCAQILNLFTRFILNLVYNENLAVDNF